MHKLKLIFFLFISLNLFCGLSMVERTPVKDKQMFQMLPGVQGDITCVRDKNKVIRLIFVRHGETVSNVEKNVAGRTLDTDLTEMGIGQAEIVARQLKGVKFEKIYTSPMLRAKRTAHILSKYDPHFLEEDPRLHERFYGPFEGISDEFWRLERANQAAALESLSTFEEKFAYKSDSTVESFGEIQARVDAFIQDIAQTAVTGNYLVVTHAGLMKTLFMAKSAEAFYDLDHCDFSCNNCAVIVVEVRPSGEYSIVAVQGFEFLEK